MPRLVKQFVKLFYAIKARMEIVIMTDSSSSCPTLLLNTMVHMLTIKLTSFNYLLWRNQVIPLLTNP